MVHSTVVRLELCTSGGEDEEAGLSSRWWSPCEREADVRYSGLLVGDCPPAFVRPRMDYGIH